MNRTPRVATRPYTKGDKRQIIKLWANGVPPKEIARQMDRPISTIYHILNNTKYEDVA